MGISDHLVVPFYKKHIVNYLPTALLGSISNNMFEGDLYDRKFGNWDINSDWNLNKEYNTIICTRCAYFAKDPERFIKKCYDNLEDNGKLYVDWGLGDHWRFKNFKVGWVKNGEQEYAYGTNNFLWSVVWDDGFLENEQCKIFEMEIKKKGYNNLKDAIFKEVPCVLDYEFIKKYFSVSYDILTIVNPYLQMYVFISGTKHE